MVRLASYPLATPADYSFDAWLSPPKKIQFARLLADLDPDSPLWLSVHAALLEASPAVCRRYVDGYIVALRDDPNAQLPSHKTRRAAEAIVRAVLRGGSPCVALARWRGCQAVYGNRRRAHHLKATGRTSLSDWEAIRSFYHDRCLRCGASGHLVMDHVIPLSRGGSNGPENIQPLCPRCNGFKHAKSSDYRPRNI